MQDAYDVATATPLAERALDTLTDLDRWVRWQEDPVLDSKGEPALRADGTPKRSKIPYLAVPGGGRASSTDPATWRSFGEAVDAAPDAKLGIVLGDLGDGYHLCGLDIDSSIMPDGRVAQWATLFLNLLRGTYGEISPSGRGIKFFFFVESKHVGECLRLLGITDGHHGRRITIGEATGGDHPAGIEFYSTARYFTLTGDFWPDSADDIATFGPDIIGELANLLPKAGSGKTTNKQNTTNTSAKKPRDKSRSGFAMRVGLAMAVKGRSYDDVLYELQTNPRTADWYKASGCRYNDREVRRIWDAGQKLPKKLPVTEDGLAQVFADIYGDRLRYCYHTGSWFEWDGDLWRKEETNLALHWARYICRDAADQNASDKSACNRLGRAVTAAAIEKFARADRQFAVTATTWDQDPWLLGTPAGTVDLRTGVLREPIYADFITKSTKVPPARTADCPLWRQFLSELCQGDNGLIRYLQQFYGYALTGSTKEHAIQFIYGPGGNGKSVLQETIVAIVGDYGTTAAMETFIASRHDRHPTELAHLHGARLVAAAETEQGRYWNETKLKQLTGGDTIAARYMHQNFFEYIPTFKASFIGNHRPKLRNVGEATRRRFNIVPFMFRPPQVDKNLGEKLQAEYPGILRWLIDGCLDWQQNGLMRPDVVVAATDEYFAQQDIVQQFIDERCETGPRDHDCPSTTLFRGFCTYIAEVKETQIWSKPEFDEQMERLGYFIIKATRGRHRDKRVYQRIRLRPEFIEYGMDNYNDICSD